MRTATRYALAIAVCGLIPASPTAAQTATLGLGPAFGLPGAPPPFVFLGAESAFETRTVRSLPYTAATETEITQALADGNFIATRSTGFVARDSEGRTRHEQPIAAIGSLVVGPGAPRVIVIHDPVARVTLLLDAATKTARRLRWREDAPRGGPPPLPRPAGASPVPGEPVAAKAPAEALGTREIESLAAEGTRSILVLAASRAGNAKPLTIVTERWYSADLDVVLEARYVDPRFGETRFVLRRIDRREPEASLFEVPAGYRVEDVRRPLTPDGG
ncbi:MAG TPA: hypothetical protein VMX54_17135 [Vicinamibacteria bacterium]|nr:hypothetical protein [Vicinamibacteria bacterium]